MRYTDQCLLYFTLLWQFGVVQRRLLHQRSYSMSSLVST